MNLGKIYEASSWIKNENWGGDKMEYGTWYIGGLLIVSWSWLKPN